MQLLQDCIFEGPFLALGNLNSVPLSSFPQNPYWQRPNMNSWLISAFPSRKHLGKAATKKSPRIPKKHPRSSKNSRHDTNSYLLPFWYIILWPRVRITDTWLEHHLLVSSWQSRWWTLNRVSLPRRHLTWQVLAPEDTGMIRHS